MMNEYSTQYANWSVGQLIRELENKQRIIDNLNAASRPEGVQWIPVGERLPSPHSDDDFIVATSSGYVTALNFGENGWYSGHGSEEDAKDGYWNGCVTHWRELPRGPQPKL